MMHIERSGLWYWEQFTDAEGKWKPSGLGLPARPPGEDLAALRKGLGRQAGTVPEMWPFMVAKLPDHWLMSYSDDWDPPPALVAEHSTLALYGRHQQSLAKPAHAPGIGLGDAVLNLKRSDRFSAEALDRRFSAAITSFEVSELVNHLRGLLAQLKDGAQALDYGELIRDLFSWQSPGRVHSVRRRWALQYSRGEPSS